MTVFSILRELLKPVLPLLALLLLVPAEDLILLSLVLAASFCNLPQKNKSSCIKLHRQLFLLHKDL